MNQAAYFRKFGNNLKKMRLQKKLSIRGLADLAEINYPNLQRIESGKNDPRLSTILALAEALGVDPRELIGS